jgi:hypothetical protein
MFARQAHMRSATTYTMFANVNLPVHSHIAAILCVHVSPLC